MGWRESHMEKKLENDILKLYKRHYDAMKSLQECSTKLKELNQRSKLEDVFKRNALSEETSECLLGIMKLEEEIYQFFLNNRIITISNTELRKKVKHLQNVVRESNEDKPFERWKYIPHCDDELNFFEEEEEERAVFNRLHLSSLVLNDNIPQQFYELFSDLDKSYEYYNFNHSCIVCRSILEIGIKEIFKGIYDPVIEKAKKERKMSLELLINRCCQKRFINKSEKNKADQVRETVNNILHSGNSITVEKSLEVIKNTFEVIERLFGNDSVKRPELQKHLK